MPVLSQEEKRKVREIEIRTPDDIEQLVNQLECLCESSHIQQDNDIVGVIIYLQRRPPKGPN